MEKTYRAIRHDVVRKKQRENEDECHHPIEKINQIRNTLSGLSSLKIMELFAGKGNLTSIYKEFGEVESYDKLLKTGDSYLLFHKLIYEKRKYDVIDIDPYGFPNRFFPDVFLLLEKGYMFLTMPKPYVNILNGITRQHLTCYYGLSNPPLDKILERLYNFGLCHWRKCDFLDVQDLKSIWRIAMKVERVLATEYCGVRNR